MYLDSEAEGYLKALVLVAQKELEDIKKSCLKFHLPNLSIHAIKLLFDYFEDTLLKENSYESTRLGT